MKKCKVNSHFRKTVCAIAFLAMAHSGYAQNIPGRWNKIALPQLGWVNTNTIDFSFIDSTNGICVANHGVISFTSNGGRDWELLDTSHPNLSSGNKFNLKSLECTAPQYAIYHGTEETLSITPTGSVFEGIPPAIGDVNYGAYVTLAEKMYDTAYGFRLVQYKSIEDPNLYIDSVPIIVTHDGWESSALYGAAYILTPDSSYLQEHSEPMSIGYIVDSNDIWTASGSLQYPNNKIIHTSNGGTSWETFDVLGSVVSQSEVKDFLVNSKTHEVFYLANLGNSEIAYSSSDIDYVYSGDYGATWRLDSTFGHNLWRLVNPAPGILWAMLGEGQSGFIYNFPPQERFVANDYSRKLGYSSDNGLTWNIDSTTFINDSLEEMHFLDARHGWVASWSNDSLFMWYYDADGTNSAVVEQPSYKPKFSCFPNPVTQSTQITFISPSAGYTEVSILNMLGVKVARLFSGELGAGEHSFAWDAAKMAAPQGAYECLVRINGQVETLPVVKF